MNICLKADSPPSDYFIFSTDNRIVLQTFNLAAIQAYLVRIFIHSTTRLPVKQTLWVLHAEKIVLRATDKGALQGVCVSILRQPLLTLVKGVIR